MFLNLFHLCSLMLHTPFLAEMSWKGGCFAAGETSSLTEEPPFSTCGPGCSGEATAGGGREVAPV